MATPGSNNPHSLASGSRIQAVLREGPANRALLQEQSSVLSGILENLSHRDVEQAQALLATLEDTQQFLQETYPAREFIHGTSDFLEENYPGEAKDIQTLLSWFEAGSHVLEFFWGRVELAQGLIESDVFEDMEELRRSFGTLEQYLAFILLMSRLDLLEGPWTPQTFVVLSKKTPWIAITQCWEGCSMPHTCGGLLVGVSCFNACGTIAKMWTTYSTQARLPYKNPVSHPEDNEQSERHSSVETPPLTMSRTDARVGSPNLRRRDESPKGQTTPSKPQLAGPGKHSSSETAASHKGTVTKNMVVIEVPSSGEESPEIPPPPPPKQPQSRGKASTGTGRNKKSTLPASKNEVAETADVAGAEAKAPVVPSAPVKKGRKATKPKVVETQGNTSSGRKQGQGAAQADDEDEDDNDPASDDEKGKAKAQGRKSTAVTVSEKDIQDRVLALQGLLTHLPKNVTDRVLNAILVGLKAQKVRLERCKLKLLLIKELAAIDRDHREYRLRLLELGFIPETPPPPPLMSRRLVEVLIDDILNIVCPTPGTGLLNGALETSFIDRDLFNNTDYDERDPEYTERQVWATRSREASGAQAAHVNVQRPQTSPPTARTTHVPQRTSSQVHPVERSRAQPLGGEPAQGGASPAPRAGQGANVVAPVQPGGGTRRKRSPSTDEGQGPSEPRRPHAHHLPDTSDAPDSEEDRVPVLKKSKLTKPGPHSTFPSSSSIRGASGSTRGLLSPASKKGKHRADPEDHARQSPSGSTSACR
ncbi:hypothetical protein V8D89_016239 [Ganoderma adspersum]